MVVHDDKTWKQIANIFYENIGIQPLNIIILKKRNNKEEYKMRCR
jgi:hypothetical protein